MSETSELPPVVKCCATCEHFCVPPRYDEGFGKCDWNGPLPFWSDGLGLGWVVSRSDGAGCSAWTSSVVAAPRPSAIG